MFDKLSSGMQGDSLTLVALKLLMLKICGIVGISKIEFLNFSCKDRVESYSHANQIITRKR